MEKSSEEVDWNLEHFATNFNVNSSHDSLAPPPWTGVAIAYSIGNGAGTARLRSGSPVAPVRRPGGMCPVSPTAITLKRPSASTRMTVMLAWRTDISSHAVLSTPSAGDEVAD
jgi:hypothetical protein